MASIRENKLKDGSISYTVTVYSGEEVVDGSYRKVRHTTTFKPDTTNKREREKQLEQFVADYERAVKGGRDYLSGKKPTFKQIIDKWDADILAVKVSSGDMTPACRECYKNLIKLYASNLYYMKVINITPDNIEDIISNMLMDGKSPKTIKNFFGALNQCMKYALRHNKIPDNPCDRVDNLPKVRKKNKVHHFSLNEIPRFLKTAINLDSVPRAYDWMKIQDRAYFYLSIYGGFRLGEILALKWKDIDMENHSITVNKAVGYSRSDGEFIKPPKTEHGYRTIQLEAFCFKYLAEWKAKVKEICLKAGEQWQGFRGDDFDDNYIFIRSNALGLRMSLREPNKRFRSILRAFNETVPSNKQLPMLRLHDLRHTCATMMTAAGIPFVTIAKFLGHANPSFTEDTYTDSFDDDFQSACEKMDRLFNFE